ncbi:MAG: hypothetical protein DMF64_20610 [Acidobacteria bacterium]|nr:MAG: hypothetical protein DMF64_20610 [Acidobacteriota bacterium]
MQIVRSLDAEFRRLHERNVALVAAVPPDKLYWQPRTTRVLPASSCGEHLLRSAACVEQTFGGLTANLWDDPFEWTLPETLPTPEHVNEYLSEVEATRQRGFTLIHSDGDLVKEIIGPTGEPRTLVALLINTLARAAHHQGRAYATFRLFSDEQIKEQA